ncbi:hypothetical protein HFO49_26110 [Rhizobium leguminosarum]|uniref:hypothetical protein n=1 Tax=Rhizobium leguminosarum TaxID=384 RepID=UPI001C977806|nr:hypothetical protein [Rhizobium leguminosarum]MBY5590919.1 hypothetical protein [Rhizobium leguminosarum]
MTVLNLSQDFIAHLRARHAADQRAMQRLVDHVERFKKKLAADEQFIKQVEEYLEGDIRPLSDEVSTIISRTSDATSNSHPFAGNTNEDGVPRRKPRAKTQESESDRIRSIAAEVLHEAGRILSGPEILSRILSTGYVIQSKSPAELFKKAIKDAPLIERRGPGYWLKGVELRSAETPKRARKARS